MVTDLIFDFFGTLVHYSPKWFNHPHSKTHALIERFGCTISYDEFEKSWLSAFEILERSTQDSLAEFHLNDVFLESLQPFMKSPLQKSQLDSISETFSQEWNEGTQYIPGLYEYLDNLSKTHRLSIISNVHFSGIIHHILDELRISKFFQMVVTSAEFGFRKPASSIFQYTIDKLDIEIDPECKYDVRTEDRIFHLYELNLRL